MLLVLVVLVVLKTSLGKPADQSPSNTGAVPAAQAPQGSLSLVTEPQAGISRVLGLINSAKTSVDLVMYELNDPQVEQALSLSRQRGVRIRVLLNGGYYGKPDTTNPNQAAYDYLQAQHVPVRWTPSYFALTHQKTLVVDGKTSLIMTFNLTPQYYSTSRDFGVTDTDAHDVAAIETAFSDDWQDQKTAAPAGDDLVWSPDSEFATLSLINNAKTSINIYNEEMADSKVVSALGAAAMRGVQVRVVMTDSSEWHSNFTKLKADGVQVHTFTASAPIYVHAKMIVADNSRAFLGSENFSTTSLERNRELGLITADKDIISDLNTTFSSDFQHATPY